MLAYSMLFTALFNAACLHTVFLFCLFFAIEFCIVIYTSALCFHSLRYSHIACLFQLLLCIMYSAFSQLVFLILCSHHIYERAMCFLAKLNFRIAIIIIIVLCSALMLFICINFFLCLDS